jgi:hypothetical protein
MKTSTNARKRAVKLGDLQLGFIAAESAPVTITETTRKPRVKAETKVRAPLPTRAPVVKSAAKLKAEAAKREKLAEERAFAKRESGFLASVDKAAAKTPTLEGARNAYLSADNAARLSATAYAKIVADTFGAECHTYAPGMVAEGGNLGATVAAFLNEKEAYYAAFKAGFKGTGRPNPSVSWRRMIDAVEDAFNRATGAKEPEAGEKGRGAKKGAVDALKRDIPKLYLRLNKDSGFANNAKLQAAAFKLGEVITMISGAGALAALNEKI